MKTTYEALLELHGSPMVKLSKVCEKTMGIKYITARLRAYHNELPFPAFKLEPDNHNSPWMVMVSDLASFIDARATAAQASWQASQV
jgi:hypothetical protein